MSESLVADPVTSITVIGGFIGITVGLITIWSQLKTQSRTAKKDIEDSNLNSENRLKEFFNMKLQIVDNKIDGIKEDVRKIDTDNSKKLEEQRSFFSHWISRLEDKTSGSGKG